jgi:hypothetical protein
MTMGALTDLARQTARAGRLIANILGGLLFLLFLAFVAGEGPFGLVASGERLHGLLVFALFAGLAVAWFAEGWGGLISVSSWVLLALTGGAAQWNSLFSIAAALGVLHLICWWRLRGAAYAGSSVPTLPGVLQIAIAAFVLLCVNEVFDNPPLFTPPLAPPAGNWSSGEASVVIGPEGSVTGTIGGARIIDGQILVNRTWFGRRMHWRTDYMIRGGLSEPIQIGSAKGDRFTAPVNLVNSELAGSLFLSHPGEPTPAALKLTKSANR